MAGCMIKVALNIFYFIVYCCINMGCYNSSCLGPPYCLSYTVIIEFFLCNINPIQFNVHSSRILTVFTSPYNVLIFFIWLDVIWFVIYKEITCAITDWFFCGAKIPFFLRNHIGRSWGITLSSSCAVAMQCSKLAVAKAVERSRIWGGP